MRGAYVGESVNVTISYPEFHACECGPHGTDRTAAGGPHALGP